MSDSQVVPFFKTVTQEDVAASKAEGRPIFKEMEVVEIRIAGDRNYAPVFPAHDIWVSDHGEPMTYAERFKDAYARFAEGREQVADGTPLSELPFLTEAKRATLRALKIYTAEALAGLNDNKIKSLGGDGHELKAQADAYLKAAKGGAQANAMAAEIETLRAQVAELSGKGDAPEDGEKEALKAQIADLTGSRPRGNPSVETLREMLSDLKESA